MKAYYNLLRNNIGHLDQNEKRFSFHTKYTQLQNKYNSIFTR